MIIIDVEIKKAILGRGEQPLPGVVYCDGWRDFANMGISCVCTYDITSHLSRVFLETDLVAFENYISGRQTAGFNTLRFDNTLLHHYGVDVEKVSGAHYDILEQIWLAQGFDPDKFYWKTHGGWGLDAVCQATLGIKKTGNGALAPVWWQQGLQGKVIDYCLNDVWMEGTLLLHIIKYGWVVAEGKDRIRLSLPSTVFEPLTTQEVDFIPCMAAPGQYYIPDYRPGNLEEVRRMASAGEPLIDTTKTPEERAEEAQGSGGLGIIR